jgi:hypothetical protein
LFKLIELGKIYFSIIYRENQAAKDLKDQIEETEVKGIFLLKRE